MQDFCAICGKPGTLHDDGRYYLDPSHVKTRGSGGGDLGNVYPSCRACHQKLHKVGVKKFGQINGIDLAALATDYAKRYQLENPAHASSSTPA